MSDRPQNRLAGEKSPYLLQHAGNPVDWYAWGDEAFAAARAADKPIFLSVGYSTCHWCHVMERESFEDDAIAQKLNDGFICIKVDREERPDVDRVYMAFVQATTGSGGWPMSVFLTTELKPFFGGTYFPPAPRHGSPGFPVLLDRLSELWRTRRGDIEASGNQVVEEMRRSEAPAEPVLVDRSVLDAGVSFFRQVYDQEHAGFGRAPKFPRPVVMQFLHRMYARNHDEDTVVMSLATLHRMALGGMYDHLAGGFHRYSVDRLWHVPHFEKMLYDQAQLVESYLEASQLTGAPQFARIARETCDYVLRDLGDPAGGFYAAEDADSPDAEGKRREGSFYVWTRAEIDELLGPDSDAFCRFYNVLAEGNADDPHGELTGTNVLHAGEGDSAPFAAARATLLARRNQRPRPHRDEKILTSWNGLMIGALARAGAGLSEPRYLAAAEAAASFIERSLWDGQTLRRRFAGGEAGGPGFLDDHAFFSRGLIELYQASRNYRWLALAEQISERMMALFFDQVDGGFFTTSGADVSVLLRMKDDYDGAEPSGNAVAVGVIYRLAELLGREEWRTAADRTVRFYSSRLASAPHAMPEMLSGVDFGSEPPTTIVLAGDDTAALRAKVTERYLPNALVLTASPELGARLPWVAEMRPIDGQPTAFVCRDHACERPVTAPAELDKLLLRVRMT